MQQASQNKQGLLPALNIPGYNVGANNFQLYWTNNIYSINGSITKILGRHTIKVGGIVRQAAWTTGSNSQGIVFTSNASTTANPLNASSGNALASFLLGQPVTTSITQVQGTHAFFHSYGFYGTDTFQATNKLTLNLGLRWDQPSAYSEVNNLNTILQPNAPNPLGTIFNPVIGENQALTGNLAFVASPQYPSRREESLHLLLFQPRVGFAYRLTSQTVVRAGYGISYLPANLTQDGPQINTINSATTTLSLGNNTASNPFPSGILQPSGRNPAGLTSLLGQTISARIPNQPYGNVQQYNASIEQAIGSKASFMLAYAANKGTHLTLSDGYTESGLNLNQLPDQYDSLGSALLTPVANPFGGGISGSGPLSGPTVLTGYLLRPHPQYLSVNQTVPRVGASTYNALQGSFQQHFNNGGIVQVAYTWAKLLSNTDNTSSFLDGTTNGVVQDYTNLKAEKSLSLQDIRQNAVINYGIELPFGQGHMFLGHIHGVTNAVVGGWRVNGITTFRSGTPLPFIDAANALNEFFGSGFIRPNLVPGCQRRIQGSAQSRVREYFNTACFTQPGQFSFGN